HARRAVGVGGAGSGVAGDDLAVDAGDRRALVEAGGRARAAHAQPDREHVRALAPDHRRRHVTVGERGEGLAVRGELPGVQPGRRGSAVDGSLRARCRWAAFALTLVVARSAMAGPADPFSGGSQSRDGGSAALINVLAPPPPQRRAPRPAEAPAVPAPPT